MRRRPLFLAAAALALWLVWDNGALSVSEYQLHFSRLPQGFDGVRIAQISDLHNAAFGKDNGKLLNALRKANPDLIFITGDFLDCRHPDLEVALSAAKAASEIAPCYFVAGNHEARLPNLEEVLAGLSAAGVTILRNEALSLERNGDRITLLGVDDPSFKTDYMTGDCKPVMTEALRQLAGPDQGFRILLSHRPEWFALYRDFGMDLTFSGHAHGGQVRLPVVGGLIAPNQGFFPRYDAGVIREGDTAMVVSRGLGPSIIPLRVGNRPELVVAQLHRQED